MKSVILPFLLMLAACSPPVLFRVQTDEPVVSGSLQLNGKSANLMKNFDDAYWAKWNGSDASGKITLQFEDGASTTCIVGYVTNGMNEIQEYAVSRRVCKHVIKN